MTGQRVAQLIDRGIERYLDGSLDDAMRLWREAAALDPEDAAARAYVAWAEWHQRAQAPAPVPAPPPPLPPLPRVEARPPSNELDHLDAALRAGLLAPEDHDIVVEPPDDAADDDVITGELPPSSPDADFDPPTLSRQPGHSQPTLLDAPAVPTPPPRPAAVTPRPRPRTRSSFDLDIDVQPPEGRAPTMAGGFEAIVDGRAETVLAEAVRESAERARAAVATAKLRDAVSRGDWGVAWTESERLVATAGGTVGAPALAELQPLLARIYDQVVGPTTRIPIVRAMPKTLDPRAGFVLSCIDGILSLDEVLDICAMPRLEALRVVALLVRDGALRFE